MLIHCPLCGRELEINENQLEDPADIVSFICTPCDRNWRDRNAEIGLKEPIKPRRKPLREGELKREREKEWRQDFTPRAELDPAAVDPADRPEVIAAAIAERRGV